MAALALDPELIPLFGADPCWTPAKERSHDAGEVCPVCAAIGGRTQVVTLPDGSNLRCGIHSGDDFVCCACGCVSPEHEARIGRGTKPRPRRSRTFGEKMADRQGRKVPRLTKKERRAILNHHGPVGKVWLALLAAERDGDRATADRLRPLLGPDAVACDEAVYLARVDAALGAVAC